MVQRVSLVVSESPDHADHQVILKGVVDFEEAAAGPMRMAPLAILIKDEHGATVGGLWSQTLFRWLSVTMLFVPEELRGRGLGAAALRQAEAIAWRRGCTGAWLATYDFQAPGFYAKLGYEPFGVLDGMPEGRRRIFMQKRWNP